ncbi:MAG: PadR family transcriptional regulator, partial [Christensenellales bacterium]
NANIDLIRSHVDTIILRSLLNEDKYGLEILNEIKEKSQGLYTLKQPTLYSCLKRLEKLGYISSYKGATSNGAQRVYYTLSEAGKNFVLTDQYQWEYSRTIIDNLLSDKKYDPNTAPPFDASALRPMTKRQPSSNPKPYQPIENCALEEDCDDSDDNLDVVADASYQREAQNPVSPMRTQVAPQPQTVAPTTHNNSFENAFSFDTPTRQTKPDNVVLPEMPSTNESNVNYISSFENLYSHSNNLVEHVQVQNDDDEFDFLTISELKNKLAAEGYNLRPYVKKNTTEYYVGKYYKPNKLLFFTSLIMSVIFFIQVMVAHFELGYTQVAPLVLCILACVAVPVVTGVRMWLAPNKRSLAVFNLKTALINSLILIINLVVIIVIVGYFAGGANFQEPSTTIKPIVVPLIMLINIPVSIVIYDLLFRSKYFHVN